MANYCAVVGCRNSYRNLRVWKKDICELHKLPHEECACLIPYRLHAFPSDPNAALKWTAALQRKQFKPTKSSVVCSVHFIDGMPTQENPNPELSLGHKLLKVSKRRRLIVKHELPSKKKKSTPESTEHVDSVPCEIVQEPHNDDSFATERCNCSSEKQDVQIQVGNSTMVDAITQWEDLTLIDHNYVSLSQRFKPKCVHKEIQSDMPVYTSILTDTICKFYTGLTVTLFLSVVKCIKEVGGSDTIKSLDMEDQVLLVLMRLRLGLLFQDLSLRFNISTSLASNIFNRLITLMSIHIGKAVFWLPRNVIRSTLPKTFESSFPNTTCIIDCSEVFIQRARLLRSRAQTYSHYKSHNTAKFLIAIAPNGFIMFLSKAYGGRAADKHIVNDSGFVNYISSGDEVMADRGFTIAEELLPLSASLNIPSFLRGRSQLPEDEVVTTRRIASVRIHVERMINRMKTFRILKNSFPINHRKRLDKIILTIGALCNLQSDLIKDK